ncbi:nucleoside deaminase [Burkholderia cenocepacia]|uniref:nucleoside deaminase n=1 Tax=Burkholderia cenocepacia TaxID=95486 RepID=UPI002939300A|nr:nucleoside deaminase [Burkholderia cenocepacia]
MDFVKRTIDLAMKNVEEGGRPFATVIVRDGEIVAESPNLVAQTSDPTAHAEILAVRDACRTLGTEHLTDCEIYILASPCPMCLGSLYYCSPKRVIYITTREDYAPFYRMTASISSSIRSMPNMRNRSRNAGCRWCSESMTARSTCTGAGRS